jgi:hypothetical protein
VVAACVAPWAAAAGPAAIQRKASLLAHAAENFVGIIHCARERRGYGPIGGEGMSRMEPDLRKREVKPE